MKVFKSFWLIMIKWIFIGIGTSLFLGYLAYYFLGLIPAIIVVSLLMLFFINLSLWNGNIKIVVDDDSLKIYKHGKLKHQYDRNNCTFSANIKTTYGNGSADSDCDLYIKTAEKEDKFDCSMLGYSRFMKLVNELGINKTPIKLETKRGE